MYSNAIKYGGTSHNVRFSHRHEYVGFVGINQTCLCLSNLRRDKILLYRVCVYAAVDFRQLAFRRPT